MNEVRIYAFEGLVLDIPIHYDEQAQMYIEDYPDFIAEPVWTPLGHRILFSGTDACPLAKESSPGGCPDCGSCQYFHRLAEHTWIGACMNEQKIKLP